ncbi:Na(+)/H(+) antiporter subunit D [uncultured Abyssibacter sp.]|uniref:Na(+)/H(+) antiporter subunit D n=1 Tax=uncultured Abyssibacter sp. TaxID=2320202 RepID=UPI0032B12183
MLESLLNPALVLILGGLLVPLLRDLPRKLFMLALPVAGLALMVWLPTGDGGVVHMFGVTLETLRIDKLSFIFGVIFHIAALLAVIYALHLKDTVQHVAALVYAGAAIGAVLAGDLITLMIYWELTALSSVFLIWARRTERAYHVGMRYLIIQVASGVVLIAGIAVRYVMTGSVDFERMSLDEPGAWLILLAFGIKCAFPFLHNWLQDAYPEATVTGTVVLSAFTTKLAIYALARGFAGTEMLIWIGAVMTAFPIFFAVIENDLRRVLAYSLNNQLGFMVVGIGIGTELAINGAAAHAFAHILYKSLLFMAMGAVLFRVGTIKASELGGLYKSMPWTATFCIIGSLSISAFPLMSGFVTKSMILTAVAEEHLWVIWLVLLFASAGVLDHSGIKIPFFSFFAHDSGKRCDEAPMNMLVAMGLTAALCIGIGIYPQPLYSLLPYSVDYNAYTTTHVITQLQLLLFAALAFAVLYRRGWYPPEIPALNLDTDWLYRYAGRRVMDGAVAVTQGTGDAAARLGAYCWAQFDRHALSGVREQGWLASVWRSSTLVWWAAALIGLVTLIGLLQ